MECRLCLFQPNGRVYSHLLFQPNGRDYSHLMNVGVEEEVIGTPSTTPLERRDIPAQLSETLEHIVGQLDVITQVTNATLLLLL